jgi:RNA polymerase sigma-70 factor (ECF subfamily)
MSGKLVPFRAARPPGGEPPVKADPEQLDDVALLAACASRDRAAVTVFFRRFAGGVTAYLSRLIGAGHPDVDDVRQLTFLAAIVAAPAFNGQSAVRTWLLGIASNQAYNQLRSRRRSDEAVQRMARVPVLAPFIDPEQDAERRERGRRLEEALADLSPHHRAAFLLCDVEGVPGPEAARVLEVKLGTLWRRLSEARARLRARLNQEAP